MTEIKLEIGNFVMYEDVAVMEKDDSIPKINLSILKITEIHGDHFKTEYYPHEEYKYYRIRKVMSSDKGTIDFPGYDLRRIAEEDAIACKKWTEKIMGDNPQDIDIGSIP